MVETRRSSAPSKRPLSSPPTSSKRSKASPENSSSTDGKSVPKATESREPEVRSTDLSSPGSSKPSDLASADKDAARQPEVDLGVNAGEELQSAAPSTKRMKKRFTKVDKSAWGQLISQSPQSPHLQIFGGVYTVGNGSQCNLSLDDTSVGKTLCKLRRTEHGGSFTAKLETAGGSGAVQVNNETLQKNSSKILTGGDEVVFGLTGKHAYIFQPLTVDTLAEPGTNSSMAILETTDSSAKGKVFSGKVVDASAATILASMSNLRALLPPPTSNADVVPATVDARASDDSSQDTEMKDTIDNEDCDIASLSKNVISANQDDDMSEKENGISNEDGKDAAANHEPRSLDWLVGLNGSISKILDERRQILKELHHRVTASSSRQEFRENLRQGIIKADQIDVSFGKFPYYLSDITKNVLISAAYIHLRCSKYAKYTAYLPSISPRILLSGPAGSDIYQETLVKALASHFGASLLIVDGVMLPGGSNQKELDTTTARDTVKTEKAGLYGKRASVTAALRQKKPASSVEADIASVSSLSQPQPKQEASTATSKNYTFKKGLN